MTPAGGDGVGPQSARRPWMPLYVADYIADTAHLSALQSGAYLHLIMHYWMHGALPDGDAALMRIARLTPAEWRRERATLAEFFHDGWRHSRVEREIRHAEDVITAKSRAGRRGAERRWHEHAAAVAGSDATVMAAASRRQLQTDAPADSPSQPQPALPPAAAGAGRGAAGDTDAGRRADLAALDGRARNAAALDGTTPPDTTAARDGAASLGGTAALEAECRAAAGLAGRSDPLLADLSPILTLIAEGYDFVRDVLPKLRAMRAAGKRGRSWAYYVPAIVEGRARNALIPPRPDAPAAAGAPLPPPTPTTWVLADSRAWAVEAAAFRTAHGRDPPRVPGLGGMGWHFPVKA